MNRMNVLATPIVLLFILGCKSAINKGIVYSPSADPLVTNGTAYDTAVLELGEHDTVVVPSRAKVEKVAGRTAIRIDLAKTKGYMGHPVEKTSIDETRKRMGCAWRSQEGKLYLATFGEWVCGDGGNTIKMTVTLPEGVRVERDDTHELSDSIRTGGSRLKRREVENEVWYSPKDSDERWTPIPDHPDPVRAAQE